MAQRSGTQVVSAFEVNEYITHTPRWQWDSALFLLQF